MSRASEILQKFIDQAQDRTPVVYKADDELAARTIRRFLLPENSIIGALAATGGISIAGGRLRLLGSPTATADRPSMLEFNSTSENVIPDHLIFAYDYVGNYYSIVTRSDTIAPGEIAGWFSDGTRWESTSDSINDFMDYCFFGDIWSIMKEFDTTNDPTSDAAISNTNKVLNFYPPLYSTEGDPTSSSKKAVSALEEIRMREALLF